MNAANVSPNRLAVSGAEAARMLGISERMLWSLRQRGEIPFRMVGRRVLFPVDALRAWLEAGSNAA